MFVGIDWGSKAHAVCVVDDAGRGVTSFSIEHSAAGFEVLVKRLARLGRSEDQTVAIERPDGRLVDRLLEAGHAVVPVSSNAIKAWREAEVLSGAKSDPGDAEVIAEYLRLRFHRLRPLTPFSEQTRALRAAVRTRAGLVEQRVAIRNQLEAVLDAFWPGPNGLFCELDSRISLAFLERYPTPASAARLNEKGMAAFCVRNKYSGSRSPAELVERLRNAPSGILTGPEVEARKVSVLALVGVLRSLTRAIKDLDASIVAQLGEHPDAQIFTSLPRSGKINAARMLAEWGDCRQAYDGPNSVAALAGLCPVTRKSGRYEAVHFRWACNKRFRNAMTCFADNSRHASTWAATVYAGAVARGADHPHAIRILARAWVRVIYRCWLDRVPYDPVRHGAVQKRAELARRSVDALRPA